jgi:hypothetical protein
MHGLGMDRQSVIQAPWAGGAHRRLAHLLAKIVGTVALAAFMISLSAGTAQALGIGEIVEELPVEVDLGIGSSSAPESGQPSQTARGLGEVLEDVTEVVAEPSSSQPAPTQESAPQNLVNTIVEPVSEVIEPVAEVVEEPVGQVTRAIEPVAEVIEEPVGQLTGPAMEAVEPVTDTVRAVVDSATGAIEEPVTRIVQTVSPGLDEIKEPLQPVLGVVTTTVETATGLVDEVSAPIFDGVDDLLGVTLPLVPSPEDLLGGIDEVLGGEPDSGPVPSMPGSRSKDPETAVSGPDQGPSRSVTSPPRPPPAGALPPPIAPIAEPPGHPDNPTHSPMAASVTMQSASPEASGATTTTRDAPPPPYDSQDAGVSIRTGVVAASSPSTSSSGSASGLLGVLVLLGLIAPRLSRWLRPRPVLCRPFALAEALELPG